MGHTFSRILLHAVWSTKNQTNSLYLDMRDGLFGYLHGIAREKRVDVLKANAVDDHVHLLLSTRQFTERSANNRQFLFVAMLRTTVASRMCAVSYAFGKPVVLTVSVPAAVR